MLAHMAVKTITIDMEAYERLARARLDAGESFSRVIKRARWEESAATGRAWAEGFRSFPQSPREALDAIEANQKSDLPPDNPWTS